MPKVAKAGKFRQVAHAQSPSSSSLRSSTQFLKSKTVVSRQDDEKNAIPITGRQNDVTKTAVSSASNGNRGSTSNIVSSADPIKKIEDDNKMKTGLSDGKLRSRKTKSEASKSTSLEDPQEYMSKGQRKRLAKRNQYLKKENMVLASLKLKKEDEQKKRIDGLDALKEALLSTVAGNNDVTNKEKMSQAEGEELSTLNLVQKPSLLKTNKSRQLLIKEEVVQMNLVLKHPSFVADPFATIRQHLQNTLRPDIVKQKIDEKNHIRTVRQKDDEKKAIKKENASNNTKHKKNKKRCKATRSKSR